MLNNGNRKRVKDDNGGGPKALTPPQKLMYARFCKGERITHLNPEAKDGGRLQWPDGSLCNWTVFHNMLTSIYGVGKRIPMHLYYANTPMRVILLETYRDGGTQKVMEPFSGKIYYVDNKIGSLNKGFLTTDYPGPNSVALTNVKFKVDMPTDDERRTYKNVVQSLDKQIGNVFPIVNEEQWAQ